MVATELTREVLENILDNTEQYIDNNDFDSFYEYLLDRLEPVPNANWIQLVPSVIGKITMFIIESGINPLNYLSEVPAFYLYGTEVDSIVIPPNIASIGKRAFYTCRQLRSIDFKCTDLGFIGQHSFMWTGLEDVEIPEGTQLIGEAAFANCKFLKTLILPDSITWLDKSILHGSSRCTPCFWGTKEQWNKVGKANDSDDLCKKIMIMK